MVWSVTNVTKSLKVQVCFSRKPSPSLFQYSLGTETIECVQSYKYLGVYFFSYISWTNHKDNISAEAPKPSVISNVACTLLPVLWQQAYETFVGPKIEYAAAIWSPHQIW